MTPNIYDTWLSEMDLPSTRREAKALGVKHYMTNAPCADGHIERRLTSNGKCIECHRIKAALKRGYEPQAYNRAQPRQDAIKTDQATYLPAKPCRRCSGFLRRTSNGECLVCREQRKHSKT